MKGLESGSGMACNRKRGTGGGGPCLTATWAWLAKAQPGPFSMQKDVGCHRNAGNANVSRKLNSSAQ